MPSDATPTDEPSPAPSSHTDAAVSPDDLLPPVEPPSAGFLVQLFLVPGLIVGAIVLFWLGIQLIIPGAQTDPRKLISGLERSGTTRWHTAHELANYLRDERNAEVKSDHAVAKQLGDVLQRKINSGDVDAQSVTMRYYICRAIGEFHVEDGLPALLLAATTRRSPDEIDAQLGALEAIALLSSTMIARDRAWADGQPEVTKTLLELAQDEEDRVRSNAAYALGILGNEEAIDALTRLVDDPYPNTRYNAAITLAQHGNAAAVETLAEMLDPDETAGIDLEQSPAARPAKRTTLITNAAEAAVALAKKNPDADLGDVVEQLERVATADSVLRERASLRPPAINAAMMALETLPASK